MGTIRLKNIRTFAYHGCLEEEAKIGSDYTIDLVAQANFQAASQSDDLSDAVDYVHLNSIVVQEMAQRSKLLEHVAQRIVNRILEEIPIVDYTCVGVSKINPPIGGDVALVTVEIEGFRIRDTN